MSEVLGPERVIREVTFAVEGDGRTIEARIVPYNTPTQVIDAPHNGGTGVPYLERWVPGAFDRQTSAVSRVKVWLNVEHERGFNAVVGHGVALREAPDALYGTFRVEPGPTGDKALHMVNEGVLTGLSIEAIPRKSRQTVDGIVERVKATLDKVSLVRDGLAAYADAQVLAVREAPEPEPEEPAPEPEPAPDPGAVDEVLRAYGFEPIACRTVSRRPWNPSRARFTDEQYELSCLVAGLPVLEPTGEPNVDALRAAPKRLSQVTGLTSLQRAQAARKLVRYYRRADLDIPTSLKQIATR